MTQGNGRLHWLDAAKGMGIILVVIAHVWTSGQLRDTIYAFHMPLFFVLAGYVARPRPMGAFLITQWRSIAIPYISFLLVLMALDPVIEHMRGFHPRFREWDTAIKAMLLGGTELSGPFTIFWFVPCLAFARIAQNGLLLLWQTPRDWRWLVAMAVTLGVGIWIGRASDFSPLGLLTVPVALVLLWLGALWRTVDNDRRLVLGAVIGAVLILLTGPLVPVNMKAADYAIPVWSLLVAVILSLGLCGLARVVPWRAFQTLGRMSLTIMFLHVAVIHYLRPYFGKEVLAGFALVLPVFVHMLLARTKWGRQYFLGERPAARESF